MYGQPPSDQAILLQSARDGIARRTAKQQGRLRLTIAGTLVAAFVAVFGGVYALTWQPPLPEFELNLVCSEAPELRVVFILAKDTLDAAAAMKAELPECELAPRPDEGQIATG